MYGKFRVGKDSSSKQPSPGTIRRNRDTLVCNQCRKAKLRCDRKQPCGSCVKRDERGLCSYQRSVESRNDAEITSSAENRLLHLESVVRQLMSQSPLTPPNDSGSTEDQSVPVVSSLGGVNQINGSASHQGAYAGATHWSSVLNDIQEIKLAISSSATTWSEVEPRASDLDTSNDLIFGTSRVDNVSAIVAQCLPARVQVDRYLSIYFSGETYIIPFIHTYQFQKEYRDFWQDITTADPIWVSILFSICYMATIIAGPSNSYRSKSTGPAIGDTILHEAAGRSLVLGQYHKPQRYAVEALAMYALSKNLRSLDPCREAGTIFGMVIRLAYQMGYHREPDRIGSFTVLEGEMRRRCWAAIKQMDLMVSFQLGLPSNVRIENCDAKPPSNLIDTDFDSESTVLPQSRPESQWSKILWFIVKDRQMVGFSKVWSVALSFQELSETDILRLDQDLRCMHNTIPDSLRARPISDSIADSAFVILTRLYLEFIHQKTICILHRKYMAKGHEYSTRAGLEAGMQLVTQFIDMHKEFSSGGQLDGERWMLSNFTVNDFLLGISVLCLFLHVQQKYDLSLIAVGLESMSVVHSLLEQSHEICIEKLSTSNDARKVARAIQLTLKSNEILLSGRREGARPSDQMEDLTTFNGSLGRTNISKVADMPNASIPGVGQPDDISWERFDPFSFMSSDFQDINWTEWESNLLV